MSKRDFESILNERLQQLNSPQADIEICLARYPEQAAALRPLLQTNSVALILAGVQSNRVGSNFSLRDRVEERTFDSHKEPAIHLLFALRFAGEDLQQ